MGKPLSAGGPVRFMSMTRGRRLACALCLACACAALRMASGQAPEPAPPAEIPTVKIGVLAKRGEDQAVKMWTPTADYLSAEVPGHRFQLVPLDFKEFNSTVEK